ncbi:MAG: ferritin-like domain-containing protein [Thermoleophilaceae bacterium]|nr:ferritin-like domain-containing protein [Thermoleophilaceae bacterium]
MKASRRQVLLGAGGASLALASPAVAAEPSDAEQLERLLGLERRLQAAYEAALARDAIDPALGKLLLGHEREHVRGLEQALGRRGPRATAPPPKVDIDFGSRPAFGRSALALERETVAAYQEVIGGFRNDRLLQPLGSIMACGAQHEVALRQVLGEDLL